MGWFGNKAKPAKKAAGKLAGSGAAITPLVTLIAADVALRAGQALVRRSIERGMLKDKRPIPRQFVHGGTIGQTMVSTMLAQVARRSVPGAIVVGGGLLAKALRDRRRARAAATADDQAKDQAKDQG